MSNIEEESILLYDLDSIMKKFDLYHADYVNTFLFKDPYAFSIERD